MTAEQILAELKQFLIENRDHARNKSGKFNRTSTTLDRVLEKLQELDPTIPNSEIYYNGTEFYPENHNMLPKA
jgi:hypothetical protein